MSTGRAVRALVVIVMLCGLALGTIRPAGAALPCMIQDMAFRATVTGSGVIRGAEGNDVIAGSNGADVIYGKGGHDLNQWQHQPGHHL